MLMALNSIQFILDHLSELFIQLLFELLFDQYSFLMTFLCLHSVLYLHSLFEGLLWWLFVNHLFVGNFLGLLFGCLGCLGLLFNRSFSVTV